MRHRIISLCLLGLVSAALPPPTFAQIMELDGKKIIIPPALIAQAEKGDKDAQYDLANYYNIGLGTKRNYTKAAKWYHAAAKQGHPAAQYRLAVMYDLGQGVSKDPRKAVEWYHHAAKNNFAPAQGKLAAFYAGMEDNRPDYAKAAQWAYRAAKQGDDIGAVVLGALYENGLGVPQNYELSYMWLDVVATGTKDKNPAGLRDDVGRHLTPAQRTKAHAQALRCIKSNYKKCG